MYGQSILPLEATSHHITSLLMRKTLELDFVWEGSLRYLEYTVSRQEINSSFQLGQFENSQQCAVRMFCTNVEFSWLADRVDQLPVEPNPRGGHTSSWKISNEYRPISGNRYLIHYHDSSFSGYAREKNNARGVMY